jgi:hypothetical protein
MYIHAISATVSAYPPLPPVMVRAVASGGRDLPQEAAFDLVRIYGMLTDILDEGTRTGVFIQTNGILVFMMILSAIALHKNIASAWAEDPVFPMLLKELDGDLFKKVDEGMASSAAEEVSRVIVRAVKK